MDNPPTTTPGMSQLMELGMQQWDWFFNLQTQAIQQATSFWCQPWLTAPRQQTADESSEAYENFFVLTSQFGEALFTNLSPWSLVNSAPEGGEPEEQCIPLDYSQWSSADYKRTAVSAQPTLTAVANRPHRQSFSPWKYLSYSPKSYYSKMIVNGSD